MRPSFGKLNNRALLAVLVLASLSGASVVAQGSHPRQPDAITVEGAVRDITGLPIVGVSVLLEQEGHPLVETKTNAVGTFILLPPHAGTYVLRAEKSGWRGPVTPSVALLAGEKKHVDLVLESSGDEARGASSGAAMQLRDEPNFVVAGVTDGTNVGGHGSDTTLRTSEALTRETLRLKADASRQSSTSTPARRSLTHQPGASEEKLRASLVRQPGSFEANHQLGDFYFHSQRYREAIPLLEAAYHTDPNDYANAYDLALAYQAQGDFVSARGQVQKMLTTTQKPELHHLLGDVDERLDDSLGAVREYEEAARLLPSEQNYFDWATELLLHRATRAAVEVFAKGASAHPNSGRMLAGLGAALYADGSYDEAARRLCQASDLNPAEDAPYIFLGKIAKTASNPLPCAEQRLARFARIQPGNALANYYYSLALWKRERESQNFESFKNIEALLAAAVKGDPQFDEAYLQLGIVYSARGNLEQAIGAYKKAIDVNPQFGEAHYRLGLAYKRLGEESKAEEEFRIREQIEKTETAAIDRQRRELRRFLIVLKDQPSAVH